MKSKDNEPKLALDSAASVAEADSVRAQDSDKPRWCRPKLTVQILEARPNPLFTEAHRELVRFLRYEGDKVPCAECGKRKKILWTMLCSFQAWDLGGFAPKKSGKIHVPLTPVCQTHLLAAEMDEVDEHGKVLQSANAGTAQPAKDSPEERQQQSKDKDDLS